MYSVARFTAHGMVQILLTKRQDLQFAYSNKGKVLHKLGRLEEALKAYEQAIRLGPDDAAFHFGKALVLERLGRQAEAEQSRWKASELPDPGEKCR